MVCQTCEQISDICQCLASKGKCSYLDGRCISIKCDSFSTKDICENGKKKI